MNKKEIKTVLAYADHFDGDLDKAAAAHVFGLGVAKMKKGIPGHATRKERSQVKEIAKAVKAAAAPKAPAKRPAAKRPAKRK